MSHRVALPAPVKGARCGRLRDLRLRLQRRELAVQQSARAALAVATVRAECQQARGVGRRAAAALQLVVAESARGGGVVGRGRGV
jgi:hypothetical protein